MTSADTQTKTELLARIAAALERMSPPPVGEPDFDAADAYVWHASPDGFMPVPHINRVPLALLKGLERTSEQLLDNTRRFADGLPANNALLWGARGMGKSSLVKAAHAEVTRQAPSAAGRNPSRGHRQSAALSRLHPPLASPLHRVLR
jgi:uncharacterized protein